MPWIVRKGERVEQAAMAILLVIGLCFFKNTSEKKQQRISVCPSEEEQNQVLGAFSMRKPLPAQEPNTMRDARSDPFLNRAGQNAFVVKGAMGTVRSLSAGRRTDFGSNNRFNLSTSTPFKVPARAIFLGKPKIVSLRNPLIRFLLFNLLCCAASERKWLSKLIFNRLSHNNLESN